MPPPNDLIARRYYRYRESAYNGVIALAASRKVTKAVLKLIIAFVAHDKLEFIREVFSSNLADPQAWDIVFVRPEMLPIHEREFYAPYLHLTGPVKEVGHARVRISVDMLENLDTLTRVASRYVPPQTQPRMRSVLIWLIIKKTRQLMDMPSEED
jgi:hypothetical protein